APPGSRLLAVANAASGGVHSWATRGRDGTIRVVLVNSGLRTRSLSAGVLGARFGRAVLERLGAPSAHARSGVTLAGQSFGPRTFTGLLAGSPRDSAISAVRGRFVVDLPPASAAMLLLSPSS